MLQEQHRAKSNKLHFAQSSGHQKEQSRVLLRDHCWTVRRDKRRPLSSEVIATINLHFHFHFGPRVPHAACVRFWRKPNKPRRAPTLPSPHARPRIRPHRPGVRAPTRRHRAHRLRELLLRGRHAGPGLRAHQQVRRGLPRQALLRRLRSGGSGGATGHRPRSASCSGRSTPTSSRTPGRRPTRRSSWRVCSRATRSSASTSRTAGTSRTAVPSTSPASTSSPTSTASRRTPA